MGIALLSLPLAYISHKIIEMLYPGQTKTLLIKSGWKIIQLCSYVEIKAISTYTKIRSFFPESINTQKAVISIICDYDEIAVYTIDEFLILRKHKELPESKYDFILYELPIKKDDKYTKCILRYENYEDIARIEYNSINNFKFNAIQFNFMEEERIVNINFNDTQYNVNGNILFDRKFLKWYMYKYHSIGIRRDDRYIITFIDHAMNYITLNEDKHIIIKKNGYDVVENANEVDANANEVDANVNEVDTTINKVNANANEVDATINKVNANVNEVDANEVDANANANANEVDENKLTEESFTIL